MFIKPNEGCLLRDPVTMVRIPPEGGQVQRTSFWFRAIARGDATEVPEPEPEPTAAFAE